MRKQKVTPIKNIGDYGDRISAGFSIGKGKNRFRLAICLYDNGYGAFGACDKQGAMELVNNKKKLQEWAEKFYDLWFKYSIDIKNLKQSACKLKPKSV